MLSLIYVSSAVPPLSAADLVSLLKQSREKNARLGVTGMLLYKDGNIMQVLEGPDDAVRQLMATIAADKRHRGVLRLMEWQIEQRHFQDWTMAFQNLSDPGIRNVPGYSEFLDVPLDSGQFRTDPSRAQRLLDVFRRNMG
jgi:acylphosphatase